MGRGQRSGSGVDLVRTCAGGRLFGVRLTAHPPTRHVSLVADRNGVDHRTAPGRQAPDSQVVATRDQDEEAATQELPPCAQTPAVDPPCTGFAVDTVAKVSALIVVIGQLVEDAEIQVTDDQLWLQAFQAKLKKDEGPPEARVLLMSIQIEARAFCTPRSGGSTPPSRWVSSGVRGRFAIHPFGMTREASGPGEEEILVARGPSAPTGPHRAAPRSGDEAPALRSLYRAGPLDDQQPRSGLRFLHASRAPFPVCPLTPWSSEGRSSARANPLHVLSSRPARGSRSGPQCRSSSAVGCLGWYRPIVPPPGAESSLPSPIWPPPPPQTGRPCRREPTSRYRGHHT